MISYSEVMLKSHNTEGYYLHTKHRTRFLVWFVILELSANCLASHRVSAGVRKCSKSSVVTAPIKMLACRTSNMLVYMNKGQSKDLFWHIKRTKRKHPKNSKTVYSHHMSSPKSNCWGYSQPTDIQGVIQSFQNDIRWLQDGFTKSWCWGDDMSFPWSR